MRLNSIWLHQIQERKFFVFTVLSKTIKIISEKKFLEIAALILYLKRWKVGLGEYLANPVRSERKQP